MTHIHNKNFWIVTLDHYQPVLVTVDSDMLMEADFSLSEDSINFEVRLRWLVGFIRSCETHVETIASKAGSVYQLGISKKVLEQMVYLAYWKNYRIELVMDQLDNDIVVGVNFPDRPELNCILDRFYTGMESWNALQAWLDFFYSVIADHENVWQIHLVLGKSLYNELVIPEYGKVHIEVLHLLLNNTLSVLLSPSG